MPHRDLSQNSFHLRPIKERIGIEVKSNLHTSQIFARSQPLLGLPSQSCSIVTGAPRQDAEEIGNDFPWYLVWNLAVKPLGQLVLAVCLKELFDEFETATERRS